VCFVKIPAGFTDDFLTWFLHSCYSPINFALVLLFLSSFFICFSLGPTVH